MEFSSFRKKYELVIEQYLHSRNVKVAEIWAIGHFFMLNHMFLFRIQKFYLCREVLNSLEVSIGRFYWPISSHVRNLGLSVVSNERFKIPLFRQKPQFLKKVVFEISLKENVSEWTWIDLFGNGAKMEFEIAILEHVRTTERTV